LKGGLRQKFLSRPGCVSEEKNAAKTRGEKGAGNYLPFISGSGDSLPVTSGDVISDDITILLTILLKYDLDGDFILLLLVCN
jgi:hypothetical protein